MVGKADLIIDIGTDFSVTFDFTDENGDSVDISTYTATSKMRNWYTSSNTISMTANVGASSLTLSLTSNTTTNLDAGRYVYDVFVTSTSNTITKIIEGWVTVNPSSTANV